MYSMQHSKREDALCGVAYPRLLASGGDSFGIQMDP